MTTRPVPSPLVSVVVPAYNAGATIVETLDSARRQTYERIEIIVVDDGSRDDTAERVRAVCAADPRVRLIPQANGGVAVARNRGIAAAQGVYIAPLDADDLWHPEKLARQVRVMEAGGSVLGLVYTGWDRIGVDGHPIEGSVRLPKLEGWVADRLILGNIISCASVPLIRNAALDAVGGYDDHQRLGGQGCEDWDLYLRIAERYRFAVVSDCLVDYRQSRGSMSTNGRGMNRSYDLMVGRLRARRPALPASQLRQSRQQFYRYLAGICERDGNRRQAWYWLWRAFLVAPSTRGPRRLAGAVRTHARRTPV